MSGYSYWPTVKIYSDDSAAVVVDLVSDLTSVQGPIKIRGPMYEPMVTERETINFRDIRYFKGYRVKVEMDFIVLDDMLDHDLLAQIAAGWSQGKTLALSLDGGTTYRDVQLTKYAGPDPVGGKPFAGAFFTLGFQTSDLVDEVPAIGTGSW